MPGEIIFGNAREFGFTREYERSDWPAEFEAADAEPGAGLVLYRRGVLVTWNREAQHLELGVGPIEITTQAMHPSSHFTTLDFHAQRKLIRDLQKAGRQMYGPDPW